MSRLKQYFDKNDWPWWGLAGLCVVLGLLLLFQSASRCPDTNRLHVAFAALDDGINSCCRCERAANDALAPEPMDEEVVSRDEVDERRADAGGSTGELTVSLAWNTTDDLDLAVLEPGGAVIYHKNRRSASSGELDVDRNFGTIENSPIENIFWDTPPAGEYTIVVSLYERRATSQGRPIDATIQIRRGNDTEVKSYSVNGTENKAALSVKFSYP
jgi:hypothetical protein